MKLLHDYVNFLRYFRGKISFATVFTDPSWHVLDDNDLTAHVLLVGEGADQFADIVGMHSSELLTENAKDIHRDFMEGKGPLKTDYDTPSTLERKQRYWKVFEKLVAERKLMDWYRAYSTSNHGTVNVIGRDQEGNLCCGVSTSGLSFKMPGMGTQPSWQGA